jgi:hypothetical protein
LAFFFACLTSSTGLFFLFFIHFESACVEHQQISSFQLTAPNVSGATDLFIVLGDVVFGRNHREQLSESGIVSLERGPQSGRYSRRSGGVGHDGSDDLERPLYDDAVDNSSLSCDDQDAQNA